MYASYHELADAGTYSLEEVYGFDRYADVVELCRADMGDMLVEPDGAYRYRLVGWFTEVSVEDASCELALVVCHEDLPLPSYEEMLALL